MRRNTFSRGIGASDAADHSVICRRTGAAGAARSPDHTRKGTAAWLTSLLSRLFALSRGSLVLAQGCRIDAEPFAQALFSYEQ
jgi:hypothetical protein